MTDARPATDLDSSTGRSRSSTPWTSTPTSTSTPRTAASRSATRPRPRAGPRSAPGRFGSASSAWARWGWRSPRPCCGRGSPCRGTGAGRSRRSPSTSAARRRGSAPSSPRTPTSCSASCPPDEALDDVVTSPNGLLAAAREGRALTEAAARRLDEARRAGRGHEDTTAMFVVLARATAGPADVAEDG